VNRRLASAIVIAHLADNPPILRRHRLLEHWAQDNGGVPRATVPTDGETISVHIHMTFRKRGGRKLAVTPDSAPRTSRRGLTKSWSRRWRLARGDAVTLSDIAQAEPVTSLRGYSGPEWTGRAGLPPIFAAR
jgi:hypothetical protein